MRVGIKEDLLASAVVITLFLCCSSFLFWAINKNIHEIEEMKAPQKAILMCGETLLEVNAKKVKQGDTFFTIVDSEGEVYIGVNKCSMRIKHD